MDFRPVDGYNACPNERWAQFMTPPRPPHNEFSHHSYVSYAVPWSDRLVTCFTDINRFPEAYGGDVHQLPTIVFNSVTPKQKIRWSRQCRRTSLGSQLSLA